jgi:glycosyltransferase involved in cell wall biosynthesis
MKINDDVRGLVSIIIPCYNSSLYIGRCLNAILNQSYRQLHLILINDGSIDETEHILRLNYMPLLIGEGFEVDFISHENIGVNASFNKGLEYVKGEYLTWCDPDDFLSPQSIEKKVSFLNLHSHYGFVRNNAEMVFEKDINKKIKIIKSSSKDFIFEDLLFEKKMPVTAGNYLIKTSVIKLALKDGRIVEGFRGQNWPMLLPISYHHRCGYINECLNTIVMRENSLSSDGSYLDEIFRITEHENMLSLILRDIDGDLSRFACLLKKKYDSMRLRLALKYQDSKQIDKYCGSFNDLTVRYKLIYCLYKMGLLNFIILIKNKVGL